MSTLVWNKQFAKKCQCLTFKVNHLNLSNVCCFFLIQNDRLGILFWLIRFHNFNFWSTLFSRLYLIFDKLSFISCKCTQVLISMTIGFKPHGLFCKICKSVHTKEGCHTRLLLNCAPMRPNAPRRAPTRPVLKKIRKSYYVTFRGSLRLF